MFPSLHTPFPLVIHEYWWETPRRNRWCTRTHRSCPSRHKIRGLHGSQIHLLTSVGMDHHYHLLAFLVFLFLLKSFCFLFLVFHTLLFLVLVVLPFQRFFWVDPSLTISFKFLTDVAIAPITDSVDVFKSSLMM